MRMNSIEERLQRWTIVGNDFSTNYAIDCNRRVENLLISGQGNIRYPNVLDIGSGKNDRAHIGERNDCCDVDVGHRAKRLVRCSDMSGGGGRPEVAGRGAKRRD
jgi:hypothetical protein